MKTWGKYFVVFLLGVVAGIAFEYWFYTAVWPNRHQSYSWIYTWRNHRKPGEPVKTDLVLDRQGYSLGYSFQRKSALWTSYVVSAGSVNIDLDRRGNFYADQDIPEQHRVQPEAHVNSGYDKGHLAPSATIDFSRDANRETYSLSNVALQDPKLNRQAWSRLEGMVRDWTESKGKLYVVTGPLYSSRPKKINGIPVPSKFYKVIYAYDAGEAIGFIFPNKAISNKYVWKYAMSVRDVEEASGLTFFSAFKKSKRERLIEELDLAWWKGE